MFMIVGGVALLVVGLYVIGIYNSLQTIKTRIQASIQEIGNQLKRQANLIPNLAESVKGYLKHEKSIFEDLTNARKSIVAAGNDMGKMDKAISEVNKIMPALNAVFESTPELKGNEVVSNLMNELRDTADKLMYSRRSLIDLTADFNMKLVTFPSNMIANMFGFVAEKGLKVDNVEEITSVSSEETKDVKISL